MNEQEQSIIATISKKTKRLYENLDKSSLLQQVLQQEMQKRANEFLEHICNRDSCSLFVEDASPAPEPNVWYSSVLFTHMMSEKTKRREGLVSPTPIRLVPTRLERTVSVFA